MPRPNKGARCDVCAHHEPTGRMGWVECRFHPPESFVPMTPNGPDYIIRWPMVPVDSWCGQFKRPAATRKGGQ